MGKNSRRTSAFWNETKVREAVAAADGAVDALRRLGYANKPGNVSRLREACVRYGLEYPAETRRRRLAVERASRPVKQSRSTRWTAEDLREAADGATSMKQVLDRLGLSAAGRNYDAVAKRAAAAGICLPPRRRNGRRVVTCDPELRAAFATAADTAVSGRHMLEILGWVECGASYQRLRRLSAELSVKIPDGYRSGTPGRRRWRIPLEQLLVKGSTYKSTDLKRRLIEEGLLDEECAECHLGPEWNGKPLVLQLEHKDGDSTNNELENLELLCPNCHSQTDTFCRPKLTVVS